MRKENLHSVASPVLPSPGLMDRISPKTEGVAAAGAGRGFDLRTTGFLFCSLQMMLSCGLTEPRLLEVAEA